MLPHSRRLNLRRKPKGVRSRFTGEAFNLEVITLDTSEKSRFAVVISKKVAKKAVDRNLARRQLQAAFGLIASQTRSGFGVIIYVKEAFFDLDYAQIQELLVETLKEANVLVV
jgi:ribonuclease P protein component